MAGWWSVSPMSATLFFLLQISDIEYNIWKRPKQTSKNPERNICNLGHNAQPPQPRRTFAGIFLRTLCYLEPFERGMEITVPLGLAVQSRGAVGFAHLYQVQFWEEPTTIMTMTISVHCSKWLRFNQMLVGAQDRRTMKSARMQFSWENVLSNFDSATWG